MDLVVDKVVQLQDVDVTDSDLTRERFTRAAVEQMRLAVAVDEPVTVGGRQRRLEETREFLFARAVEGATKAS